MKRATTLVLLLVMLGCSRQRSSPSGAAPSSAPSAQPRAAASGSRDGASRAEGGSRCPSRIVGAETSIKDVEGGVELRVTASDPGVTAAIRSRITAFSGAAGGTPGAWAHCDPARPISPSGGCPVVHDGTRVSAREVDGGAVFVITAESSAVACLRLEARARADQLKRP